MKKSTLRENLLVTFGTRAAYMDCNGSISLPNGSAGEDELADYAVSIADLYLADSANSDIGYDEFIERALMERYGTEIRA